MTQRSTLIQARRVRTRRASHLSAVRYVRCYIDRVLTALAIVTPIVVMLAAQFAPGPGGRPGDELVTIAMAASDTATEAHASAESDHETHASLSGRENMVARVQAAPARPVGWYRIAAADHGLSPYLLEALHQIETSGSPDGCVENIEGSGAIGPFQFKRATFAVYGEDANNDGKVDICGFADSLVSAARYLHALGADDRVDSAATRRALVRYGTDANRVIDLARLYAGRAGPTLASLN